MRHLIVLVCCALPVAVSAASDLAATATIDGAAAAGVAIRAEAEPADPTVVRCTIDWLAPSDRAVVSVVGPAVVLATTLAAPPDHQPGRWSADAGPVAAGERAELVLELTAGEGPVVVVAERGEAELSFQSSVSLERIGTTTRIGAPTVVRLRHERISAESGAVLVEHLGPKLAIAAEVFADDATDYPIPDGPTDCSSGSTIWPLTTFLNVASAPAAATVTALTVHLNVTHPDMSDLQIVFSKEFNTVAKYLWRNGAGVNLDRDYTSDIYSGSLPGIGGAVNGLWILAARDCYAGATGTLTYWSVRIQYSSTAAIDLVADSLTPDPATVAPGATVEADWSGHVAGSGTVGGPFTVAFYLSNDTNITTGDTLLGQTTVSTAVNPGDTFGQSNPGRNLVIPGGTADGSHYLGMIVDSGNAVGETNEANNIAWAPLTVASGGGGGCLFGVSELTLQNGRFRVTGGAFLNGLPTDFFLQNLCPDGDPSQTSAAFYFNIAWPPVQEGFVSIRDECSKPRNAYIVEVACASTRKFYIDVTDTWTSTTHRYQNPTGGSSVCFPADATSFQGSCP